MNFIPPLYFLLFSANCFLHVSSDSDSGQDGRRSGNIIDNFEPTLAVVTGVLSIVFMLTFSVLIYAKCCYYSNSDSPEIRGDFRRQSSRSSGIDKTVIESLPFFRFSYLKGSRQGLECAVCLSKFEDIEILRLLPDCKHAFHIACIDQWLERHATCPLCRQRVSNTSDPSVSALSNSLRFLNQSEDRQESNLELYIEREERQEIRNGSFRRIFNLEREEDGQPRRGLHKLNHKIVVSDFVFRQRWSNVSSSDLMFLNSEMISSCSSRSLSKDRTPESSVTGNEISEMPSKLSSEKKVSITKETKAFDPRTATENPRSFESGRRSVSDITAVQRFNILKPRSTNDDSSWSSSSHVTDDRRRRLWLPIARRTAHWFANRERGQPISNAHNLDV